MTHVAVFGLHMTVTFNGNYSYRKNNRLLRVDLSILQSICICGNFYHRYIFPLMMHVALLALDMAVNVNENDRY